MKTRLTLNKKLLLSLFSLMMACMCHATTFTVSTLADNGAGSLRQAIIDANAAAGADIIDFSVAGTLTPTTTLPSITSSTIIDGTTAPGYAAGAPTFQIEYGGTSLTISGADVTLNGLAFWGTAFYSLGVSTSVTSGTTTIDNCAFTNFRAIHAAGAQTLVVHNSSFTNCGTHSTLYAVTLASLGSVDWSGNTYSGGGYAFQMNNMDGLLIDDGTVPGADIVIEPGSGFSSAFGGGAFNLGSCTNTTVKDIVMPTSNTFYGLGVSTSAASGTTTIDNCDFTNFRAIHATGAQQLVVNNSSFTNCGTHSTLYAITLNTLGSVDWSDNTYSGGGYAFQMNNMDGLLIDDGTVTGADIVIEPASGFSSAFIGGAFNLGSCTNTTVKDIVMPAFNTFYGLGVSTSAASGTTTIDNCDFTNFRAIHATGAQHLVVNNSSFTNCGTHSTLYAFTLNTLGSVDWSDNTYSGGGYAFQMNNMDGLLIDDGTVPGADIVIEPGSGFSSAFGGGAFNLGSCTNTTVKDIVMPTSNTFYGLGVSTSAASGTTTIDNCDFTNFRAISASGAQQLVVNNSSFTNCGTHSTLYAITLNTLGSVDWSDNTYSGGGYAFQLYNMDGLLIDDGTVAGADISIEEGSGFSSAFNGIAIKNTTTNLTIDGVDLSGTGGTAIVNTGADFTFQNLTIDGRTIGIQSSAAGTNSILTSTFSNLSGDAIDLNGSATATITHNTFACLSGFGVDNNTAASIDAENNYWSLSNGPVTDGGSGEPYEGTVDANPFLAAPHANAPVAKTPQITVNHVAQGTDFGHVNIPFTHTIQYTITNDGGADLILSTISSTNGTYTIVNNTGGVVPAGSTATFDVVFAPTVVGVENATISISNNNCYENLYTFNVTGTGIPPCNATDPISLVVACQNFSVDLTNGAASISANDVDNGSSDGCGPVSLQVSPNSFDCSHDGPNTVTLTGMDIRGNTQSCTATITVMDDTPPVALCGTVTRQIDELLPTIVSAGDLNMSSTDNCGITLMTIDGQPSSTFDCSHVGTNPVLFTVTDAAGNTSTTNCDVVIEDNTPAVISLNGDNPQTVCEGDAYAEAGAAALDYCEGDLTSSIQISGSVDVNTPGSYPMTYTVSDAAGNTASVGRTVQVKALPPALAEDNCPSPGCGRIDVKVCQYALYPDLVSVVQGNPNYQGGASLVWYLNGQPNNPLSIQPPVLTDVAPRADFFRVSQSIDGCEGPSIQIKTRVKPSKDPNLDMDLSLGVPACGGASMDLAQSLTGASNKVKQFNFYEGKPNAGGTFLGSIAASSGNPSASYYHPVPNGTTSFYVQSVMKNANQCGGEATDDVALQVGPTLDPISNITVDHGDPVSLNFTGQNTTNVYWFNLPNYLGVPNPDIGILGAIGLNTLSFTASNLGVSDSTSTLRVIPYNGNCAGTPVDLSITIRPAGPVRQGQSNRLQLAGRQVAGGAIALDWNIVYDQELTFFEVEKEVNEDEWVSIAEVGYHGNGQYGYTDRSGLSNTTRYRLKLIHTDGHIVWSKPVEVKLDSDTHDRVMIYPNPTNNQTTIELSANEGELDVVIYDMNGRMVWSQHVEEGEEQVSLDVSGSQFSNGIYLVNVIGAHINLTKRLVVVK